MNNASGNPEMPETNQCPQCGTPLKGKALAGLCPACLLAQGATDDTVAVGQPQAFIPPSPTELAAFFPQFEILELIGRGGMGAVYKARQKQLDRIVALKILPPGIGNDPAFAERFTREAKALAKLNHSGIVTIHDFGVAQSDALDSPRLYYFIMEFVDGVTLRQLLIGGRVSAREALAIVPQICDALQFAHDHGIVHRDIKPENILLDRRGRVKVADFGLVKLVGGDVSAGEGNTGLESPANWQAGKPALQITEADKVMGTPNYMAPEQKEKPTEVDHRADIYALGVVFYQLLTGELPGKQIEPPSRKVQIDVRLDEIVMRALEKNPELRYDQASELKTQVESVSSTPGSSRREEAHSKSEEPKENERNPLPLTIIGVLFFLSGCTAAWDFVNSIPHGIYSINVGILGIPIAIGLLRHRSWWRRTALAGLLFALTGTLAVAAFAVAGDFLPGEVYFTFFGPELTGLARVWIGLVAGGLFFWMFRVLIRSDVKALFRKRGFNRPWIEWAALAGVLLLLSVPVLIQGFSSSANSGRNSHANAGTNTSPRVEPTSVRQLNGGPFIAYLPDGGSIELLAVRSHPSTNGTWWLPNGEASSYDPAITLEQEVYVEPGVIGLARVVWPSDRRVLSDKFITIKAGRRFAVKDGRRLPIDEFSIMSFPLVIDENGKTTLPVDVGIGPWETLGRQKPGWIPGLLAGGRAKYWKFEEGVDGSLKVIMEPVIMDQGMEYRLVAEDIAGKLHTPWTSATTKKSTDVWSRYEATFDGSNYREKLPLKQLKEARWQGRPYKAVQFRNVSLRPGHKTTVEVLDFGEPAKATSTGEGKIEPTSDFEEYMVNKTWAELAKRSEPNTPEVLQAKIAMQVMEGDLATVLNELTWDAPRWPAGSVSVRQTESEKTKTLETRTVKVITFQGNLAAIISRQLDQANEERFLTLIAAQRDGCWKRLLFPEFPEFKTQQEAESAFREMAREIQEIHQNLRMDLPDASAGLDAHSAISEIHRISQNLLDQTLAQVQQLTETTEKTAGKLAVTEVSNGFGVLQFRWVASQGDTNSPVELLPNPSGGEPLRVEKTVAMNGDTVAKATLEMESMPGSSQISLEFTPEGKVRFAEITRKNIGRQLAILHNNRVLAAPMIVSEIPFGRVLITGNFSEAEAAAIVDQVNKRVSD